MGRRGDRRGLRWVDPARAVEDGCRGQDEGQGLFVGLGLGQRGLREEDAWPAQRGGQGRAQGEDGRHQGWQGRRRRGGRRRLGARAPAADHRPADGVQAEDRDALLHDGAAHGPRRLRAPGQVLWAQRARRRRRRGRVVHRALGRQDGEGGPRARRLGGDQGGDVDA